MTQKQEAFLEGLRRGHSPQEAAKAAGYRCHWNRLLANQTLAKAMAQNQSPEKEILALLARWSLPPP